MRGRCNLPVVAGEFVVGGAAVGAAPWAVSNAARSVGRLCDLGVWGVGDERQFSEVRSCLCVGDGLLQSVGGITTSLGFEMLAVVEVPAAGGVAFGVEDAAGYSVLELRSEDCSVGVRLFSSCASQQLQCKHPTTIPVGRSLPAPNAGFRYVAASFRSTTPRLVSRPTIGDAAML